MILNDASLGVEFSASQVYVDPVLGLTSYLIRNNSPLVVHRITERDNCFIFVFKKYRPSLEVAQLHVRDL